jgi:hypothetical protein
MLHSPICPSIFYKIYECIHKITKELVKKTMSYEKSSDLKNRYFNLKKEKVVEKLISTSKILF